MSKAMKKAAKELRKHLKKWRADNPSPSWANRQEVYKTPSSWSTIDKLTPEQMDEFAREVNALPLSNGGPLIFKSKLSPEEIEFLENHEVMSAAIFKTGKPGGRKSKIGAKLAKKQGIPVKKIKPSKKFLPEDFAMPDPVPPVPPVMLKRFILFYGAEYYPSGGWGDFEGSFDTLEEALIDEIPSGNNWWHVIDITTGEQVADSNYGKRGSGTRLIDREKLKFSERKPL